MIGPAEDRLTLAIVALADKGRWTRCADPATGSWWTSDDPEERLAAAELCPGCRIWHECDEAAKETRPTWGVWAAHDYDPRPRRRTTT